MRIRNMQVNHLTDPLGYECEYPVFSWVTENVRGKCQEKVRMEIALDRAMKKVIYDSGWQREIDSCGFCPNVQISPRTRYYWRVKVLTDRREKVVSPVAWFETGKSQELWQGQWIQADFNQKNPEIHPLFQKKFQVPKDLASARIYICGLGLFEVLVNGEKVSEEYLAPFYTDYHNWIQYVTYDITPLLKKGEENAVGAALGNGWYKGRFSYEKDMYGLYGKDFQLLAELRLERETGEELVIATDESWECGPSPVKESGIYDGEVYDARLETDHFATVSCTLPCKAVKGPGVSVPLKDRLSPPLRIIQRIQEPKKILTPAGETVLDFGQEITGWAEFLCDEEKGREIRLQYGEVLQDGCFYRDNLRTAKAEMTYISSGEKQWVRPHFTFYGFRYVKVTGMTEVDPRNFTACVIHSDIRRTGNIQTSSEKVNRLFENTVWGQKGNFLDVPIDCPQRDERLGWTGDAQAFCATASFHMETPAFYRKYLYDMKEDQKIYRGGVPHVVPDVLGQVQRIKNQSEDPVTKEGEWTTYGSCAWGDAACIIPWTLYKFYGDEILLAEQYPIMRDWVDYIFRVDEEQCGGSRLWSTGFHFADWLALDNPDKTSSFGGTDNTYVATAFYYYSAMLTAKAAYVLGIRQDARAYRQLAKEIKAAFRRKYFDSKGDLMVKTQTAMVLALYFKLAPKSARKKIAGELKKNIRSHGMHLTTGFVGTCYLCLALSEMGMDQEAYSLLLQEEYPGWLYEVNMGATTVWERWNSILPDGHISDTGMNSLNHYAYGVIAEWMYRCMCGLNPAEKGPGFRRAVIAPKPDRRLGFARCSYDSARGLYESGWEWKKKGILFQVRVPFNTRAKFILPYRGKRIFLNGRRNRHLENKGKILLDPGSYEIFVEAGQKE